MQRIKFGTDGVRGEAGTPPMDVASVVRIGRGVGKQLRAQCKEHPRVLIGRDTRRSGDMLASALATGLLAAGVDVADAGVIPTAGVAHLTRHYKMDLGAVISASHNPWQENGIKLIGADGFKLEDEAECSFEEAIAAVEQDAAVSRAYGRLLEPRDWTGGYVRYLVSPFEPGSFAGLKVVLDCSNGAASRVAPECFARLGASITVLHASPDGQNINNQSGSEYLRSGRSELPAMVRAAGAHMGVAFDGDADRAIFVDEEGTLVDGDYVLFLLARRLQEQQRLGGGAVVTTTMANSGLEHALRNLGIPTRRTPVGDKYVLRDMLAGRHVLGGEQSGHIIIYDEDHTTGDGIYTALYVASVLAASGGRSFSELARGMEKLPQVIASARVPQKKELSELPGYTAARDRLQEILGDGATLNVRYSGTEPVVRVMIEAGRPHEVTDLALYAFRLCRTVQEETGGATGEIEIKDCVTGQTLDVNDAPQETSGAAAS